jgi:hemerythrin-like domain-containing protein
MIFYGKGRKIMKATEVLMKEHEIILRVLSAMEMAAAAIPSDKVHPSFFLDAADFIKGFADGCHHAKEEGALFPAMEAVGVPAQGGPIGMLLAEHEQGRVYTHLMRAAAEKWQAGDASVRQEVITHAIGYIRLLRMHIQKENNILFPMAERVVPVEKQPELWDEFERIEHEETGEGVHEKYETLADKLEQEASKYQLPDDNRGIGSISHTD